METHREDASPALAEAVEHAAAMDKAHQDYEAAKAKRDAAILRAHDDGAGPTEIGRRLSMSTSNVHQVVREQRLLRRLQ
jgi:DNA-binding NarL/FixJ family response regulator